MATAAAVPAIAPSSYWSLSRAPRYSLTLALPLLALYEISAMLVSGRSGVRNGAEVMLKQGAQALVGRSGPFIFLTLLVVVLLAAIVRDTRKHGAPRLPVFLGWRPSRWWAAVWPLIAPDEQMITSFGWSASPDQLGLPAPDLHRRRVYESCYFA